MTAIALKIDAGILLKKRSGQEYHVGSRVNQSNLFLIYDASK